MICPKCHSQIEIEQRLNTKTGIIYKQCTNPLCHTRVIMGKSQTSAMGSFYIPWGNVQSKKIPIIKTNRKLKPLTKKEREGWEIFKKLQ